MGKKVAFDTFRTYTFWISFAFLKHVAGAKDDAGKTIGAKNHLQSLTMWLIHFLSIQRMLIHNHDTDYTNISRKDQ